MGLKLIINILKVLGFFWVIRTVKREINKLHGFFKFITLCAINLLSFFSIWGITFAVGYKFVPPEGDNVRGFLFVIIVIVSFLFSIIISIVLYLSVSKISSVSEAIVGGIDAAKKGAGKGVKVITGGVSKTKDSLSKSSEAVGDFTKKTIESTGKMIESTGKIISNSAEGIANTTKHSVEVTTKWTKETAPKVKDAINKGSKASVNLIMDKSQDLGGAVVRSTKKVIDAGQKGIESSSKWAKNKLPRAKIKIDQLTSKLRKKKDDTDAEKGKGD